MIIYYNKGSNEVSLSTGERKLEKKIKVIRNYDKKEFKTIMRREKKKGKKLKGVYLVYTWGYKTKEPSLYLTTEILPESAINNLQDILNYSVYDIQEKGERYTSGFQKAMDKGTDIAGTWYSLPYFLREITFRFVFE